MRPLAIVETPARPFKPPMTNHLIAPHSDAAGPPAPPPTAPAASAADAQAWLNALDRDAFEQLISRAYHQQGYEVLPSPPPPDSSVDAVLTRQAERLIVLCGQWRRHVVDARVVRELSALVAAQHATWGIVATSGRFTPDAYEFARHARLTLLDGPAVLQLLSIGGLDRVGSAGADVLPPAPASPVPAPSAPPCPDCSSPMMLHTARLGHHAGTRYWICSRSPRCAGVRNAPTTPRAPGHGPRSRVVATVLRATAAGAASAVVVAGITVSVWSLGAHLGPAMQPPGPPSMPLAEASLAHKAVDIAYDVSAHRLYIADASGELTIASAGSMKVVRRITVPGTPVSIATDGAHHRAFVADSRSRRVFVIDTTKGTVTGTIQLAGRPFGLAFDPERQRLFVTSRTARTLSVVNTATLRSLGSMRTNGVPTALAIDSRTHRVSVAASTVDVYSGSTLHKLSTLSRKAAGATDLAVDPRHRRLYFLRGGSLMQVNLRDGSLKRAASITGGRLMAIDAPGQRLFITGPGRAAVQVVRLLPTGGLQLTR